MSGIDRGAWMRALEEATHAPLPETDALTTQEFADLVGISGQQAHRRLRVLVATGKAKLTTKQIRTTRGSVYPAPAYRLTPATKRTFDVPKKSRSQRPRRPSPRRR